MEISYRLDEVEHVAKALITNLSSKVLLFNGSMGVGKTTLIKAIIKELGSNDDVNSPTFSIVNQYELSNDTIYHFDLYRVNDLEEAYNFGIEDYLYDGYYCLIEWPEIIESLLPEEVLKINIEILDNSSRKIIFL